MNRSKIAFIGLGNMGKPMAENLLKAGWPLAAYDVKREAVEALQKAGAAGTTSVAEAVRDADIIITILPRDEHILLVYTGDGGILEHAKPDAVCIEMTSARGETVESVAKTALERGKSLRFLDAPVSGGVAGAQGASLTIMCGGDKALFEECKPVLETLGKKIFYTGALGSGKALKMVNQLLNAGNTLVAAEAVFLAKHLGLDMDLFVDIVKESSGNSWVFSNNIPKFMLPKNYDGGFRLDLLKKDISLSMSQIQNDNVSLPISTLVYQIFQAMENQGHGGENYNVAGEWIEQQNK